MRVNNGKRAGEAKAMMTEIHYKWTLKGTVVGRTVGTAKVVVLLNLFFQRKVSLGVEHNVLTVAALFFMKESCF